MRDGINETVAKVGIALQTHTTRRQWELGANEDADMVGLMLCDLMLFAKARGVDFAAELVTASETFADCYQDEDFQP